MIIRYGDNQELETFIRDEDGLTAQALFDKFLDNKWLPFDPTTTNYTIYKDEDVLPDLPITPQPHTVSKLVIINRLIDLGKFFDALDTLESDRVLYQKWNAAQAIRSDDEPARALFTAIELDPDEILAPE